MREALLFLMLIAAGFVASGLIASLYMLLSGQREYSPKAETDAGRLAAVGLTIFTGPAILTANAIRSRSDQPPAYLPIVLAIASLWSFALGLLFVPLIALLPLPF